MIHHDEHTRIHISIMPNADQLGMKRNTGGTDGSSCAEFVDSPQKTQIAKVRPAQKEKGGRMGPTKRKKATE